MRLVRIVQGLLDRALGQSSPLLVSRLASAALTFGLPLILVRLLEPEGFGTYKQFFLVGQTLLLVGQMGITQSLYFFLPRGGGERGAYVTHALFALGLIGAIFGGLLYVSAPWIAGRLGSGELALLGMPLGLFAGGMLAAAPLESALTAEGRIGGAALSYVLSDAARASLLVGAARFFGGRALFWAAAAVAIGRVTALYLLVWRRVLPHARARLDFFRKQLAFALPFAGASLFYVGQRYFAQYAVSARFSAATFALYSVAAFHLPVVDIIFTPVAEVLMVTLGKTLGVHPRLALGHWDDAVLRLASLLFPAAIGAWLLGPRVLPLLFTGAYKAAVPLFLLTTFEILLWVLPLDSLLRAAGETHFLFVLNAARVAVTALFVLGGIHLFGLRGAIVGGLLSEALARGVMLVRGRRILGVGLLQMLDWPALLRIACAALVASVPTWIFTRLVSERALSLVLAIALYGLTYFAVRFALGARPRIALDSAEVSV